ncbi:hypothetical protein PhCBS80983_g04360 [Powellomyces hirtus]|uniref:Man(5)GlcNAc(2)-PP-dolichol translocation protein RFT1 n=1 Tax=Powellomyces hirtus TaxID=109895 RepID=A0A507DY52_9FUNG|nr:hypothetical protein PhCBS80983_g04360 [Powellomyces hirtus]
MVQDPSQGREGQNALNSSIKGAGYLFLLQLSSRMATFLLNNFIQRVSSITTVGMASGLELLSGTILFLSRENLRMVLLRSSEDSADDDTTVAPNSDHDASKKRAVRRDIRRQQLVNLSYLPMLVGLLLVGLFALFRQSTASNPGPSNATRIYILATLVELCSEPMYLIVQSSLMYNVRAKVEGFALLVRCLTTFSLTLLSCTSHTGEAVDTCGVESYAWGHLAYAVLLVFGYLRALSRDHGGARALLGILRPRQIKTEAQRPFYFDPYLLSVAWSFMAQSGLKYVLTEGDRIILLCMGGTNDEKGAYKMVSDLGSLIARIVFQPIEEAARAFFSRTLASRDGIRTQDITLSIDLLSTLIRFHLFLATYFVFFATNYSGTLISVLYGSGKASTPEIVLALSVYCLYVPLMGINGITEGFVQGVGDSGAIRKQSYWMVACSAVFVAVAFVTMKVFDLGPSGLILANMANMVMRIWFCWSFLQRFLVETATQNLTANARTLCHEMYSRTMNPLALIPGDFKGHVALVISWLLTFAYMRWYGWATWKAKIGHVVVGGICALCVTGLM